MNKLSLYIREKREEKGITIEELSKRTLISPAVLKDIEAGKFDKYSGEEAYVKMYLKKISNALDMNSVDLTDQYITLAKLNKMDICYRFTSDASLFWQEDVIFTPEEYINK